MNYNSLFITKSSMDTTAILFVGQESSSTTGSYYKCADIVHSAAMFEFIRYSSNYTLKQAGMTVFAPVVLGPTIESYTPDVYFTPYTQYQEIVSKLTANGREYFYNGIIALGD